MTGPGEVIVAARAAVQPLGQRIEAFPEGQIQDDSCSALSLDLYAPLAIYESSIQTVGISGLHTAAGVVDKWSICTTCNSPAISNSLQGVLGLHMAAGVFGNSAGALGQSHKLAYSSNIICCGKALESCQIVGLGARCHGVPGAGCREGLL